MSENYFLRIITGNYQWELSSENYRDLVYNITWKSWDF